MRRIIRSVLVGAIVGCSTASALADVKLNSLFTDNMVLQRDIPAKVFGTADDGESVIVSINGQTAKTTAKGGEWLVALKPMKAGGPHRLTIEGKNTLILQNVVFGDVWLCTGQSNMDFDCAWFASPDKRQDEYRDEYGVQRKKYIEIAKHAARYKNLRMFVAEKRPGAKRAGLEAVKAFDKSWQVSAEKYTLLTSAMGYVFGLRLHQHLNIPIGLIDTNKSGSPIETWMSAEALKAAGLKAEADSHYNGNIFPVQKFAIKGVIWYQGESNAKTVESSIAYGRTFPTMIESWRKEWGQGDFPFLYVQLAGWDWNESVRRNWPLLRESQDKALALPNVGAALAIDKGARRNIHPIHKISVSERLVLAARKHAYDEDLVYSGPTYKSHEVRGGNVEVVFDHVGGGLIKKAFQIEDVKTTSAKLEGFELSADGHSYFPAEATIQGDKVVVSSDAVKSPKHLRYAWTGFPKANLFNKADLPAHPFRTDGADSPATDPAVRMKAWDHHVKLRESSIFKDVAWTAVGPRIQGGKIESIWSVKKRKSTLYAGAGSGNLWKSVNNGTTWKPVFENESTFSISVVTVSDDDPNLVWVGTGEPHMARSSFAGTGVFKSTDGAKTWKHMGLTDTHHIGRVLIDPKDSNVVYVAALGHQYSYNKQRGVFKTTDGGKTWKKVLYISEKVGVVEVAIDPSDNKTLYAVAWERDRKAWNNVDSGPGSGIYKSIDAGETWKLLTKGLPTGEKVGRMGIAIAPSNPNVLYIICDHRGVGGEVYRSDNKGESWRKTHEGNVKTGIGYDFCLIRVLPDNADEIFICGFNLLYSPDAGKTQTSISERTIPMLSYKARRATPHCDNHDMFIDPDDPDRVMLGTDGGLYISHDRAKTWLHVNTLPIAEFYAISVDAREPYKIWGGTQDNGVLGGEAKPMTPGLEHWEWDLGGDNYVTRIDPNDLDTMYLEGMFGGMGRKDLKTGESRGIRPGPPPEGKKLRFNWMTPFILSHYDSKTLYAGANMLFKSENRGDSWKCISPDLSTNPGPEREGNVPFGTITDISESALKKGLLYAGTDDGQLHVTRDDGATWTQINKDLPNRWVSRVVASKYDEGTVFVSLTGYREDDFEAYLYRSTDFGETWKSIVNNMPSESINVIREDPADQDILYVGTELGAYCSIDKGKTWHSLCKTLPTCAVHDLAVHAGTGDLVAGTHGRSAFVLHAKEIQKMKQEMAK